MRSFKFGDKTQYLIFTKHVEFVQISDDSRNIAIGLSGGSTIHQYFEKEEDCKDVCKEIRILMEESSGEPNLGIVYAHTQAALQTATQAFKESFEKSQVITPNQSALLLTEINSILHPEEA